MICRKGSKGIKTLYTQKHTKKEWRNYETKNSKRKEVTEVILHQHHFKYKWIKFHIKMQRLAE